MTNTKTFVACFENGFTLPCGWTERLEELREDAAAATTYREYWDLEDSMKDEREQINKEIRSERAQVTHYRRIARKLDDEWFAQRAARYQARVDRLVAIRDELTAGIRAYQAYERWSDKQVEKAAAYWREVEARRAV